MSRMMGKKLPGGPRGGARAIRQNATLTGGCFPGPEAHGGDASGRDQGPQGGLRRRGEVHRREPGRQGAGERILPRAGRAAAARRPRERDLAAEVRVPRWEAQASSGNGDGIFDAAYAYGRTRGEEGGLVGMAEQVADELAALLAALTRGDVEAMRSGLSSGRRALGLRSAESHHRDGCLLERLVGGEPPISPSSSSHWLFS